MEDYCRERKLSFGTVIRIGSVEAIKQAVMAGMGISYFSSFTVRHEIETGRLVRLRVRGISLRRSFYLINHRRKRRSEALRKFMDFAGEWAERGGPFP
jgi:DNA-binding transcriptional LysR family regulator